MRFTAISINQFSTQFYTSGKIQNSSKKKSIEYLEGVVVAFSVPFMLLFLFLSSKKKVETKTNQSFLIEINKIHKKQFVTAVNFDSPCTAKCAFVLLSISQYLC